MSSVSPKKPEIMAPVGDSVCLDAAIKAGADAVYFGIEGLNMRAGAKNFTVPQMRALCKKCAAAGVRKYLTLNTIYYQGEMPKLRRAVMAAKRAGVDAIIAWDFAALQCAREAGVEAYLSTQASAANAEAIALYFKNFGIRRFVLARECQLADIPKIRKALAKILGAAAKEISFEVFAHGAMCVSISGRCFMSQFQCGKSANRGECMQPCRREYFISDGREGAEGFVVGKGYVMSPKDLCTLPFIEKLIEAGVNSLKIEGRNRSADYVFETAGAYRKAVDFYFENRKKPNFKAEFEALKSELALGLKTVFNRGFSSGFYMGKPIADWTSEGNRAEKKKTILGHVTNYFSKLGVAQISIDNGTLKEGQTVQAEGETTGFLRFEPQNMRLGGEVVKSAKKGDEISVKVPQKLRKNDRLYIFK
ncbi:MAG: U32 family peptidase [Opitutales bacterium]|nr:U32 family peptidase [Opitutales bacterium]